jgi:hypothetical protein
LDNQEFEIIEVEGWRIKDDSTTEVTDIETSNPNIRFEKHYIYSFHIINIF